MCLDMEEGETDRWTDPGTSVLTKTPDPGQGGVGWAGWARLLGNRST